MNHDNGGFYVAVICVIASIILSSLVTISIVKPNMEEDAIKNGVGEYYLNEKHQRHFRWIQPSDKPLETGKVNE